MLYGTKSNHTYCYILPCDSFLIRINVCFIAYQLRNWKICT